MVQMSLENEFSSEKQACDHDIVENVESNGSGLEKELDSKSIHVPSRWKAMLKRLP